MSRNLLDRYCYFCKSRVSLTSQVRLVTEKETGVYYLHFADMIVADAECDLCGAKYLAWVSDIPNRINNTEIEFQDLSFRSTFNDEPGPSDMPKRSLLKRLKNAWKAFLMEQSETEKSWRKIHNRIAIHRKQDGVKL